MNPKKAWRTGHDGVLHATMTLDGVTETYCGAALTGAAEVRTSICPDCGLVALEAGRNRDRGRSR